MATTSQGGGEELDAIQRAAQDQFSRQSGRYGRGHILEQVEDVQEALRAMPLTVPARVLDVATGAGHTGLHLAGLGHRVALADISPAMLERAKEAAARRGLTVDVRQHPAEALPYADGAFDLVTCRVAAHHFSSPEAFLRETARVLRPGGWFLLIDGSTPDNDPEAEEWLHQVEKLRDPSHVRFGTPARWRGWCEDAGLHVTRHWLWPKKQPDLNWYFETAATPAGNRQQVLELVANAPASARRLFRLGEEDGKVVWWWQMLTLIARRG